MLGDSTPSPTPTPVTTNNKKTTTAGRRKTRPEAGTSAIVESSFPKPVCDSLYESWVSGGSSVDYGAFRKALLPLYPHSGPRYTQEELTNAITAFLETRDGVAPTESQFWTVHKFAGDVGRWVRLGSMPVQLADGTLTERGIVALGEVLSA